ncbi:MAG: protoporphyrinogen oxidase [Chloroflexi bacterium]|nr:protoporphyrinogen oxidase [Chloroflexota bacterium]
MQVTADSKHVVIIGGGISGLSTAWYLQQTRTTGLNIRYTVLEQSNRWGGKVLTEQVEGVDGVPFVVEAGPDSFLTQKPWALQLAREVGLADHLLGTNDHQRNVYVLNKGKPVVLPDGVLLIVPTKFTPFALSPLISPLGKLRMGLDLLIPPKKDDDDETLADFVRRRLGSEALDKIAEPLMSGIYNAESERQSILATFPRFRQLERDHGSLIRGMLASRRNHSSNGHVSKKRLSAFMSLQNGTQELITALVNHLDGALRLGVQVRQLAPRSDSGYTLTLNNGETLNADLVVMTTPAYTSADLVRSFAPVAANQLAAIRYVSTGTVSLAFHEADIQRPLNGFGVVIPQSEGRPINAITVSSTKFDHRAPEGYALLRVFFGGSRSPESFALDDETLLRVVQDELRTILGIEAVPLFHRIFRWHRANPQYDLDHLERVSQIEASLPEGLFVTGSAYRGVGMPDCVYQAQQTAQQVMTYLNERVIV